MAATTTTATTKPMSVEELWELRDEPYRLALIDGELYRMPGAGLLHGEIAVEFVMHLKPFVAAHGLGTVCVEVGFRLFAGRLTTVFPDVAFVRAARLPPPDQRDGFLELVPDLAIEIYSPGDRPKVLREKLAAYAEAKTPLVWVAYPKRRSVVVHRHGQAPVEYGADETLDGGEVLPGFSVRVGDCFP